MSGALGPAMVRTTDGAAAPVATLRSGWLTLTPSSAACAARARSPADG